MQLAEINAEGRRGVAPLPEWFANASLLASLEELNIGACGELHLSSIWAMVKSTASTLTKLIIPSDCFSDFPRDSCYPKLVLPRLEYLELYDHPLVPQIGKVIRILTAIETSVTLRHLVLDQILWYNRPIESP
jgi:hypothetical protein